jgi:bifunctional UDP-N-acetylglucosamine pyrophosphorylase/glucosamine-1-phosphate N-acetyltransferase
MRKIKNILLLAGGDSTRFWPLEDKLFYSFLGKPFILYQVEELSKYGEKITVIASKKNAVSINRLIENSNLNRVCSVIIQKDEFSGQAGAIASVRNQIKGEVLIINGSDMIDYSIILKLTTLINEKNRLILVGKKFNEYFSGGYFRFDDKKNIVEIIEKPDRNKLPSSIVKLVVDYFYDVNELINLFPQIKTKEDNLYELAVNKLLSGDSERTYLLYDGSWDGLKYPWQILSMMKSFLLTIRKNQIASSATISKNTMIIPPVFIGENVKIGNYSKIVGPVYIDDNTIVGDYALIRESQIGQDSLVGSFTEVARSYIGNRVYLHRNYVGDSVLADKVMLGAQAITANLKFNNENVVSSVDDGKVDTGLTKLGTIIGKESKIGVNSTILPGIKIGKKSLVGPGETVRRDLEDNIYLSQDEKKNNLNI